MEKDRLVKGMNWSIEAVGILSGVLIYGAMLPKNLKVIKSFLLAGAVGFLSYGVLLGLPAIMIINSIGVVVGIYGVVKAFKSTPRRMGFVDAIHR